MDFINADTNEVVHTLANIPSILRQSEIKRELATKLNIPVQAIAR